MECNKIDNSSLTLWEATSSLLFNDSQVFKANNDFLYLEYYTS